MTVIAGLIATDKSIIMGGDSAGVSDFDMLSVAEPKVFANGPFLIGFTSSFRMGDILRYADLPIFREDEHGSPHRFMVKNFIPVVRTLFKDAGYMQVENQHEQGGTFLVGFHASLFGVWSGFEVLSSRDGMLAVGCGGRVALGAMIAMEASGMDRDETLVEVALKASLRATSAVRGPFVIIRNPPTTSQGGAL